ncbi:MAG TPA: ComEC/Rec2 family competence protein [Candidatus Dormibacteraeota bacterium]
MTRLPPAILVCGAWVLGVAVAIVLAPGRPLVGAIALCLGVTTAAAAVVVRPLRIAFAVGALFLGVARAEAAGGGPDQQAVAYRLVGATVQVAGTVADDPKDLASGYELLVAPTAAALADGTRLGAFGDVLVIAKGVRRAEAGDTVQAGGKLTLPADAPGFDRRAYLAAKGAWLELRVTSVNVIGGGRGFGRIAARTRDLYRLAVDQLLPPPHAAVLEGIVLGVRTGIPPPLNQALIATGLIHLLVLSGLKVAVFARLVTAALRGLVGRVGTWAAVGLVAMYAAVGGATPAAVRAAAMGALVLAAGRLGRPTHVWTSLAVTAAVMVGWQPELAWDVGYQLSFLGTAAIILLTPPITARLAWMPAVLREPFAVTCAAQIGTAPLVAADFHVLALVGPLANALVLPLLPAVIALGLLVPPLALLPALGHALVLPLAGLLAYLEQIAAVLSRVPGAALTVPTLPATAGLAYYFGLGGLVAAWGGRGESRPRRAAVATGLIAPLLIAGGELVSWSLPHPQAAVLAIGDGQALLLRGPGGYVLVDGGPSPARLRDALGVHIPPWQRDLAALVITSDGIGEVGGLAAFDRRAAAVLVPAAGLPGTAWRRAALAAVTGGARYLPVWAGERLMVAGLRFDVLSPERTEPGDEVGWGDLAFRATGPSSRALCAFGDLSTDAQRVAASHLTGRCDYVVFDGRGALDPDLVRLLDPTALVLSSSVGTRTPTGLALASLHRTDQEGDVTLGL